MPQPARSGPEHPRAFADAPLLCVALLVTGFDLMAEHWLALEGHPARFVRHAGNGAMGLTTFLILEMARDMWQQRRAHRPAAAIWHYQGDERGRAG